MSRTPFARALLVGVTAAASSFGFALVDVPAGARGGDDPGPYDQGYFEITLRGFNNGKRPDRLLANADVICAGERARLRRVDGPRVRRAIGLATLDDKGNHMFHVGDPNGRHYTTYVVRVSPCNASGPHSDTSRIR